MPTASATSPMMPPSASTSRTRCPLATPPMAGLQLICAIRSMFMVMSAVLQAHARRGHRRLAAGMSRAHYHHIVLFGESHPSLFYGLATNGAPIRDKDTE